VDKQAGAGNMLRIGIIGTGGISAVHLRGYLEFPRECRIVALCDAVPDRAEERKAQFGLTDAHVYDDPATMLAAEALDVVSIATPPSTHARLAVDALRAGVNVLVEKPMAPSVEECDAMLAAERESGKLLSVVAQNRFRDDMATLKEALDSGLIGTVSHAQISSAWWRGRSYYDLWWRGTWASEGGGCTLNHAIHHIDLALWMLGRPRSVTAVLTNVQHDNSEVEDLSVAILQYERALAELTSSVVHHGEEQAIVVQGEFAKVAQPWSVTAMTAQPNGFPTADGNPALVGQLDALAAAHVPLPHLGHAGQIGDVLRAVRERRRPAVDGVDGRNAVEVVTAIYEAGIERRTVDLPLSPADPYYHTGELVRRAPHFFSKTRSESTLDGAIRVGTTPEA
jgi:predicted dehydrogenase